MALYGLDEVAKEGDVHLRVEEAGRGLNNSSDGVIGRDRVQVALGVGNDSHETQTHILGMQILGKGIADALGLAGLNCSVVLHIGQVAHNGLVGGSSLGQDFGVGEGTSDKGNVDGCSLLVGYLNQRAGSVAVDQAQT